MKRALVIGGTRFIGRHLVERLLADGVCVTIATRGLTPDAFGGRVERKVANRSEEASLRAALGEGTWDVCFDQVCHSGEDARAAAKVLAGRIGRYVLTSSGAVYPFGPGIRTEADFDARVHPAARAAGYEEGKRQAERATFEAPPARCVAVRLPMVLGEWDHTRKLESLAAFARAGTPVPVVRADFETGYLSGPAAAEALVAAASSALEGAVNVCSDEAISLATLAGWMDAELGTHTTFAEGARVNLTPLAIPGSLVMSNALARQAGLCFEPLARWLLPLLRSLA